MYLPKFYTFHKSICSVKKNSRKVSEVIVGLIAHIWTVATFISQSTHALQAILSFRLSARTPTWLLSLTWPLIVTRLTPCTGVVLTSIVRSATISQAPCLPKPILTHPVSGMIWQYGAVAEVDKSFQWEDARFELLTEAETNPGATGEALPACMDTTCKTLCFKIHASEIIRFLNESMQFDI